MNQKNVSSEEFSSYIQRAVESRTLTIHTNSSIGLQIFSDFKDSLGFTFPMLKNIAKPQDFDIFIERLIGDEFIMFLTECTPPVFVHFASLLADINFLCYGNLALVASFCSYVGYKSYERGNSYLGSFCLTLKDSRATFEQKYEISYFTLRLL